MKLKHLFENEVPNITDSYKAYTHASKQKMRIPALEPVIKQDPLSALLYVQELIKGRWTEAEPFIQQDLYKWDDYIRMFPELRTFTKDVPLVIGKYALMDIPNTITDEQVTKLINILQRCKKWNPDINNIFNTRRIYNESLIKYKLKNNLVKKININKAPEQVKTKFLQDIGALLRDNNDDFS